jgi:hypothetical protein
MSQSVWTILKREDSGCGIGDVIIDLPTYLLESINLALVGSLSIDLVSGAIVVRPTPDADSQS